MAEDKREVFLSYTREDQPAVGKLAELLRKRNVHLWLDMELKGGARWREEVERHLKSSRACIICIGPHGMGRGQERERDIALSLEEGDPENFKVIPVLLPKADPQSMSLYLTEYQWIKFGETLEDEQVLDQLIRSLQEGETGPGPVGAVTERPCPYRGLDYFDVGDDKYFFGREALTEDLLGRLRSSLAENRFLAIVGPSGSGKSSLARAGLLAALRDGRIPGSEAWPVAICTPRARPLEELAFALAGEKGAPDLMEKLAQNTTRLHLETRSRLHGAPADRRFVLLIDQFEEVFTLSPKEQRGPFVESLLDAATVAGGRTVVILTLRSDFYGPCTAYDGLARMLSSDRQRLIGEMKPEELRSAIERPAEKANCELEPGLTELLLRDLEGQRDCLPLLQHALQQLWERRENGKLIVAAYTEIGGVRGALDKYAESIREGLTEGERELCRQIFLKLVQVDDQGRATKRRVGRDELISVANPEVLEKLTSSRLLRTEGGKERRPTVELAHESLITGWKRLEKWINESLRDLQTRRELEDEAKKWDAKGRDPSYLLTGTRLDAARTWAGQHPGEVGPLERELLDASIARQEREIRRYRRLSAALAALLVLALFAGGIALYQRQVSERQRLVAIAQNLADRMTINPPASPLVKLLLSIESVRLAGRGRQPHLSAAEGSLREALARSGGRPLPAGRIQAVAISPDRRWLATAGVDGRLLLWDLKARDPAARPEVMAEGQTEEIRLVAVSRDARWVLAVPRVGPARLLSRRSGEGKPRPVVLLEAEDWLSASEPFSPEGRWLATRREADGRTTLILRDVRDGMKTIATLRVDPQAVAFSADGRWLAAAGDKGGLRLWELTAEKPGIRSVQLLDNQTVGRLAFSFDSRWLAATGPVGRQEKRRAWNLEPGATSIPPRPVQGCAPGGHLAAAPKGFLVWRGNLGCWWSPESQTSSTLAFKPPEVASAGFSSDGRRLAAGGDDGLQLFSLRNSRPFSSLDLPKMGPVHFVGFDDAGAWLVTQGGGEAPRLWDLRRGKAVGDLEPTVARHPPGLAAITPAGWRLVVNPTTRQARLWDSRGRPAGGPLPGAEQASAPWVLSRDGRWLAAAGRSGKILVWKIAENGTASLFPLLTGSRHPRAVTALAFSSGGRWLASGDEKGQTRLWDLRASQAEPQSLTNQEGRVTALAFSPKDRFLATAGAEGAVYLREISETGVARADAPAEPTPRGSPVTALAFSPDGRLAMAGQDDRIIVWRAGEREMSVESAQKKTLALAFSPDGEWLAGRADDGTAQLWSFDGEQPSRKPVELPASGAGAWRTLTFTTDGTGLITADEDGEIRRWELRVDELIETACKAAGRNLTRREWETYIPTEPYRGDQPCPAAIRR